MNGLAGYYVSTIGKPHEYFDLTTISAESVSEYRESVELRLRKRVLETIEIGD